MEFSTKGVKVKHFKHSLIAKVQGDLESQIQKFLTESDNEILNVQYSSLFSGEQGIVYSALLFYRKKESSTSNRVR